MKLPWPNQFENGDFDEWVDNLEKVAICNGLSSPDQLLTIMETFLGGRAKSMFKLKRLDKSTYANAKAELSKALMTQLDRDLALARFENADMEKTKTQSFMSNICGVNWNSPYHIRIRKQYQLWCREN